MPPYPRDPPSRPASPSSSQRYSSTSHPLAAQIPLQSFTLPEFPPEAFQLRELTLTCDIKLDEYQSLLQSHAPRAPRLPVSITSLTLELFSLGFPTGWLTKIGEQLPNLKSFTVFSSLLDGLDDHSRKDAETFFQNQFHFKELHFIDTFVRSGFWTTLGELLQKPKSPNGVNHNRLQYLEVSYTYRGHSDPGFMSRTIGEEVPALLVPGIVAANFNLEPPQNQPPPATDENDAKDTLEDPANLDEEGKLIDGRRPEGILPFPARSMAANALMEKVRAMKDGMRKIRMLNLSLWTLTYKDLEEVLRACTPHVSVETHGLAELCVCIEIEGQSGGDREVESWWIKIASLLKTVRDLEGLEIIGVPSRDMQPKEQSSRNRLNSLFPSTKDLEDLARQCPRLQRFEMTTLRTKSSGYVKCWREIGSKTWTGGFVTSEETAAPG